MKFLISKQVILLIRVYILYCSLRLIERSSSLSVNSDSSGPVKIPLNLGSGYSADFEVFDRDYVLVAVGFGFYCQMTWKEAVKFCDARVDLLERKRIRFNEKMAKVEEDLKIFNDLITKLL